MKTKPGFTLIEMLIVVAIIGILSGIAIPNLLEAQIRSKVARVKSDFRVIAGALEAYSSDHGRYPREVHTGWYDEDWITYSGKEVRGILWHGLTTPVPYLTTFDYLDPLANERIPIDQKYYTYQDIEEYRVRTEDPYWDEAAEYYGKWLLGSIGTDKMFFHGFMNSTMLVYDPTNGTVS
ncbi:prepilin-type N-terminal cleavage/methylation domain-containing protein, partial [Candidatus Sumerlaeota bacterium]|nr:prepilin-type N-terminal cleavage/methylation domain-containing protein [Candidatus Sumerlaeota bacterium]